MAWITQTIEWRRPAVRVNETDTFADEDGANDEYFDFEDISGAFLHLLLVAEMFPIVWDTSLTAVARCCQKSETSADRFNRSVITKHCRKMWATCQNAVESAMQLCCGIFEARTSSNPNWASNPNARITVLAKGCSYWHSCSMYGDRFELVKILGFKLATSICQIQACSCESCVPSFAMVDGICVVMNLLDKLGGNLMLKIHCQFQSSSEPSVCKC